VDTQGFLEIFSRGFRQGQTSNFTFFDLFFATSLIAFLIGAIIFVSSRKIWLHGRWIYFRKRWKGEAISKDRRTHQFEVIVQMPYRGTPERCRTVNLSPNGMFVKLDPPLMVGESFRFLLNLPNGIGISGTAEVRWSQEKATDFTPVGMGCKFHYLRPDDRNEIRKALRL